ncbi:cobalt/nickel transport system permease protein [Anaerobacterium chartisolvens]|uniref:Cobalt/nickel transport system permease protein n=1 Tax=Anaerobacterium chartisolvens TaxID=1297424 RepID=A0A369BCU6_9FIRM|nr:cobalt ECF transporter T component CbiQ [Anaerobacterium chartisolvens]RCX18428.1 cobalt/nickel transport system permease protein [Anaerobacterium chartisolvens]
MTNITNSLYTIRFFDMAARKGTFIHRIHPVAKLLAAITYILVASSFGKYDIIPLLPLVFYPVVLLAVGDIPVMPVAKRMLLAGPFIAGMGILNPLFDHGVFYVGGVSIGAGWIACMSLIIKGALTVMSALLLIAITGMDKTAQALRMLKVPRAFVLQLLLTYRYISVLMEETARVLTAYNLRASARKGSGKGVKKNAWGSLAGQLLLRTLGRAERVHGAMLMRGFNGEYNTGELAPMNIKDIAYLAIWVLFFAAVRIYNIPALIGLLITGVL